MYFIFTNDCNHFYPWKSNIISQDVKNFYENFNATPINNFEFNNNNGTYPFQHDIIYPSNITGAYDVSLELILVVKSTV